MPILLFGVPLYLYANLFAFPNIPFLLDGDQVFFWVYAQRMLYGEHAYRDFFQFTPPGTDFIYLAWFRLFDPHLWVANVVVLLLGVALCGICFSISKQVMDTGPALLATLLFLVFIYGRLLDATHHWFSMLALLCAVRIVMPGRSAPRIAMAGALFAVASFFTQTAGVAGLIALLVSIAWEGFCAKKRWRIVLGYQLLLAAAFGLVLIGLNAYFIAEIGWKQLWYFQVSYPQHYLIYKHQMFFPELPQHLTWRRWHDLVQRLFIYGLVLVIYPSTLWLCWRKCRSATFRNGQQLVLLSLLGFFLLLEIITRVNWTRLYIVSVPALILLIWAVTRSGRLARYVMATLWFIVTCLALAQTVSRHRQYSQVVRLPAGRVALSAQNYEKFFSLMQYTKPGDFFFQAPWPNVYLPLELRSPVFVDVLWPDNVTRPEYVERTIQQLECKQVKYILWSARLEAPEDPSRPWEYHLGPLRAYLHNHYKRIRALQDQDELWQRK
ncbi:MAG TPA: hypothetical protein VHT28_16815 [Silvibacterium sp.]|nr:hypothetical protein [Silvibacterium sp.]